MLFAPFGNNFDTKNIPVRVFHAWENFVNK